MTDTGMCDDVTLTDRLRHRLRYVERLTDEKFRARDVAVSVAIASLDIRLNSMNEFRETLRDQATRFVTREEYIAAHATVEHIAQDSQIAISKLSSRAEETDKNSSSERAGLDKRLDSMNEFRAQLKDQAVSFVTRAELEPQLSGLASDVRRIELAATGAARLTDMTSAQEREGERIKLIEAKINNWDGRVWALGVVFLIVNGLLSWVFANLHVMH
jgi:hypothetical protein